MVISLTAARIAEVVGGSLHGVDPDAEVAGPVVTDSRLAERGSLFVAVAGEHTDGHDHASSAHGRGAVLTMASRAVDAPHVLVTDTVTALGELAREVLADLRRRSDLRVVGITGSVGKTTTKDLLGHLLAAAGPTVAPRESYNNEIGLPLTVLAATERTRYLVLEMGASGVGHIDYLTAIAPLDVAVALVVGHAHLESFGSVEQVARAKAEIVAGLRPGGVAVLNADDPRVLAMAATAPGPVVTFGHGESADVRATEVVLDERGRPGFTLRISAVAGLPEDRRPVDLPLVGRHQVYNALAAVTASMVLGVSPDEAIASLSTPAALSRHRMALTERPDGVRLLDDAYNANPDSLAAALRALAAIEADRRVAVIGDMLELGPEASHEHEVAGELAVDLGIDLLLAVGAHAEAIVSGADSRNRTRQRQHRTRILRSADVDAAEALLDVELRSGDVVLLKASNGAGLWRLADRLSETRGGGAS